MKNLISNQVEQRELKLPKGIEIEERINKERMKEIILQFCRITSEEINDDILKGKEVKLIFPLDGGFLIYWELKKFLREYYIDVYNRVEFIFAAKTKLKDENGKNFYDLSVKRIKGDNVVIYNIDDIFDLSNSNDKIYLRIEEIFKGVSFEFKTRVVSTKEGKNYYEVPLNPSQYFRFKDLWVTSGFGMNSDIVTGYLEVLERVSGISFYITDFDAVKAWTTEDKKNYQKLLEVNCYFIDPIERAEVIQHLQSLLNKDHKDKFEEIRYIHET